MKLGWFQVMKYVAVFVVIVLVWINQPISAQRSDVFGFVEYGYPNIRDHYQGRYFLGYGQTIYTNKRLTLYLKPEISRYKLEGNSGIWNAELDVVSEYILLKIPTKKNIHLFYLIGELGYNEFWSSKIDDDNGFLYSIGLEYTNAPLSGSKLFVHYQEQHHNGTLKNSNTPIRDIALIKFGIKAEIWRWWVR